MVDLNALSAANAKRWADAKLTRPVEANNIALHLFKAKARYQAVEAKTGVPWPIIAVIHERESSQDWKTHLGQGDPLDRVTVHVPAGRGPFFGPDAWEQGAVDALAGCPPYLARRKDWSLSGSLMGLETFNGIGYFERGAPSPYLWAGTDQYRSGKFVRDGVYDPSKVDPQMGCAALLKALMVLDPTITFTGAKVIPIAPSKPAPAPKPPASATPSLWSLFASFISAIISGFRRK